MFGLGSGKCMQAITFRHEVHEIHRSRIYRRADGVDAWVADRPWGQPHLSVGVEGRGTLEIIHREISFPNAANDIARINRGHGVLHRGIGLQSHPDRESIMVDGRDQRALRGVGRLALND